MEASEKKGFMERIKNGFRTRRFAVGAYSVLAVVLVVAIAVIVNLAVGALPSSKTQVDLTAEKLYSLSEQTEQRLSALDQDVTVYWIVQKGSEDATLEQLLGRYADFKHVSVQAVDPVTYPNFAASYTSASVENNSLIVTCGERSLFVAGSELWTYSDYEQYVYYLQYYGQEYNDTFVGEQKLTGAIAYVSGEELPVIYTLTGHGETELSEEFGNVITLQNYELQELNLLTVDAVPEDCGVLYIAGPTHDLNEQELAAIRSYVAAGGKLFVTTNYTEEDLPNFAALLADWSVSVTNGIVLESDSRYVSYGYIDFLLPSLQSHSITSPLSAEGLQVLMPDAQALTMGETEEEIQLSSLLKSSASSYSKSGLNGLSDYSQTDTDPAGPFVLALAGKNSSTGSQLVVFGSSVFMESAYSDRVAGANEDLFLNAMDWLCGHSDNISIHAKTLSVDYFTFNGSSGLIAAAMLVIVVPLMFLGVGIGIFVKRRRR